MTDISKEAVTHSAATCLLLDGRFVKEADYRAQAARIEQLEAALRLMMRTYPYNPPCHGWQEQVKSHKAAKMALIANETP